jgi:predicted metalloprotease
MRLDGQRESSNVDDRRSGGGGRKIALGGGLTLVIAIIALLMGKNPQQLLETIGAGQQQTTQTTQAPANDADSRFVRKVLGSTEDVWEKLFTESGKQYQAPVLVLFKDEVESACGYASSASGPFYCPGDNQVYIDLAFYHELGERFKAPGDFAMAYVIAHEVGHHVQNLLGISTQVQKMRRQVSEAEANKLSVRLELQADFLAGVWAHHAQEMRDILEPGDLEEALNAAHAIGDDNLQKQAQGYVVPDAFTHGTSEQRMHWFKKGFDTGDMKQGDTFGGDL